MRAKKRVDAAAFEEAAKKVAPAQKGTWKAVAKGTAAKGELDYRSSSVRRWRKLGQLPPPPPRPRGRSS